MQPARSPRRQGSRSDRRLAPTLTALVALAAIPLMGASCQTPRLAAPAPVVAASSPSQCFDAVIEAARIALKYRTPLAPSLDGNTVDTHLEQAAFAENAVRYQATLTFLNSKFRSLMTAITGQ